MNQFISFIGLFVFLAIAFLLSESKKDVAWRTIGAGILIQVIFGLFILKTNIGVSIFSSINDVFSGILNYSNIGANFVFGRLTEVGEVGFVFATMVLPTIIFMSSLMSVLYHIGFMEKVIKVFAYIMAKTMNLSGAESLAAAANIFSGQTEAPLVVRPYINKMTHSEIMALMTGGMATVAGGVFAAYVGMGINAGHLLAASVMSAPAALVCAKLLVPEREIPLTRGNLNIKIEKNHENIFDAATDGASEGLKLALNVAAMLMAFIALIALVNGAFLFFSHKLGLLTPMTLERLFGYLFAPMAWFMGVPWSECGAVGVLLGKKITLNEFVAYQGLQKHILAGNLSERAITLSTYALCGFANFGSVAVQIGGIGGLAPDRRKDFASLGIKSLIGGTLACLMTASIVGIFI